MPMLNLEKGPYAGGEITVDELKQDGDHVYVSRLDDPTGEYYVVQANQRTAIWSKDESQQ